jgi:pimeloyl-ACP methyl ester carboxylesterase/DNA-binding CsgD family transcriptional regulator
VTEAPATAQRLRFLEHGGRRVAYAVTGTGPPLLCDLSRLHHLDVFWRRAPYRQLVEALSRRFTVIRFDRPGCGLSDRTAVDLGLAAELALFDRLTDALSLPQTAVLAAGSAAPAMVAVAALRPGRVARLALFGARIGPLDGRTEFGDALHVLLRTRLELAIDLIAQRVASGCGEAAVQWFAAALRQTASADVIGRWVHETTQRDVRPLLASVRCPTLLMHRREDALVPFEHARDAAAHMRDAVLLPLDGAESVIWEGDVDALLGPLLRFLAQPPAGAGEGRLTAREREVVMLVADGLTNEEIGARLRIGRRTVESRLERARSKLGLISRAALAAWATRTRLS